MLLTAIISNSVAHACGERLHIGTFHALFIIVLTCIGPKSRLTWDFMH